MNIVYRTYGEQDKEAVKKLLVELVIYIATLYLLRRKEPHPDFADKYLQKMIQLGQENKGVIYVACDNEVIVGCATGIVKEQSEEELLEFLPVKLGSIPDLYVSPNYRGKGIGSALISYVEHYFKSIDCTVVELSVMMNNTETYEMYKRLGYRDSDIFLQKPLIS